MSIPIDNSIQLNQPTFTSGTPDYTTLETWTKSGNNIYSTIGTNVGIGVTNPSGRLELNFDNSIKLKFGNTTGPRTWNVNQLFTNFFFDLCQHQTLLSHILDMLIVMMHQ